MTKAARDDLRDCGVATRKELNALLDYVDTLEAALWTVAKIESAVMANDSLESQALGRISTVVREALDRRK